VAVDGVRRQIAPGDTIVLTPGESICLEPFVYHKFYGKTGAGTVIIGEVSDVNDDCNDNCFLDKLDRYPIIIEDELPLYYLCTEYPKADQTK